jgi:hypothetical protein
MKPDHLRALIVGQGLLIAALVVGVALLGRDEFKLYVERDGAGVPQEPVVRTSADKTPIVSVRPVMREGSGIEIAPVEAAGSAAGRPLNGVVLSTQGLLDHRLRAGALRAAEQAAQAQLRRAQAEYARTEALFRDERNASERALQAAQADFESARAQAAAAAEALRVHRQALVGEWGGAVADKLAAGLDALAAGRKVLLQVVTDPGAGAPTRLQVRAAGAAARRQEARLLGATSHALPELSGTTFLYLSDGEGLRPGMRVVATAPDAPAATGSVRLPAGALVWYGARAWVYAKVEDNDGDDSEEFARRDVTEGRWADDFWITPAVPAGVQIVTRGAQLLLSEETRGLIKNENDD